jgi:hypothetical protein
MKVLSRFVLFLITGFNVCFFSLEAFTGKEIKKLGMIGDLDTINHVLEVRYAPAAWKKIYAQWNLENELQVAKDKVALSDKITTKHFQQIVAQFLNTMKDYHVQVSFASTEAADLPFSVKSIGDKYYVDWMDPRFDSLFRYSMSVGDELVLFDGRPVEAVIADLRAESGLQSNPQTDRALLGINLTHRTGKQGFNVPEGPVLIVVKSALTGLERAVQLIWNHRAELIFNPIDSKFARHCVPLRTFNLLKSKAFQKLSMLNPLHEFYIHPSKTSPAGLGAFRSFLPDLGEVIWEGEDLPFQAYIYKNEEGRLIGFVRIPSYIGEPEDAKIFARLVHEFQTKTDALVIDQLHNPGGQVLYQYALASCLTDYPLATPRHRLSINQEDVLNAHQALAFLEAIGSDEELQELLLEDFYFSDLNYILFLKNFYSFIISEWNAGRSLTNPTYLDGVDYINPHPKYRYTKPILILIDELDFSGGDFFPAIFQDNQRALLFGARTAGAGGCVSSFSFPNLNGIRRMSYTWSIAERLDGRPIENLGVTPDIPYELTQEDILSGYRPYIDAVNRTLNELLY